MSEFTVGDMVYVNSHSLKSGTTSTGKGEPEKVEIIKITPKRFKISWDCDGQRDEPLVVYVKNVYKTYGEINPSMNGLTH